MSFLVWSLVVAVSATLPGGCAPAPASRAGQGEAGATTIAEVDAHGPDGAPEDGGGPMDAPGEGGTDAGAPSLVADAAAEAGVDAVSATWVGPPQIVAVGNDGRRLVSVDGNIWKDDVRDVMGNRDGPKVLRAVAYGNRVVVAVGGACAPDCTSRIMTFDGETWTEAPVPPGQGRLNGVAYGNGIWVAVGASGPVLRSTDNGRTWVATGLAGTMPGLRAVAFGKVGNADMFVAVGDGYTRARSVDGAKWTDLQPSNGTTDGFRGVVMGNGAVVAVGGKQDLGRRLRSTDGVAWADDVSGGPELGAVVFVDGKFMAFSSGGDTTLHVSSDGKSWTTHTTMNPGSNVAAGQLGALRLFVSRTSPATIKISTDGITWTTKVNTNVGDATINAFTFAGN